MTDWPVKTLGELFEFKNGRGFKKTEWSTSGLPIIRIQNLNSDSASYNYFSGTFDEGILVEPGDLLFSWSGSIGTSFGPHIWRRPSGLLNQHIFKVSPKVPIDTDYAHYCLRAITAEIERSVNGAVGLVHITKEKLNKFEIPVPPLEEQKRIVELLDAATARVTELTACYEQARTHANNLFASALREVLESNPDWPVKTLGDVCDFVRGVTYDKADAQSEMKSGFIPLLRATNITEKGLLRDDFVFVPKNGVRADQKLISGDALITIASGSASVVGRSVLVEDPGEMTFGAFCGVLRPRSEILPRYLSHFMSSRSVRAAWSEAAQGTNINNLKRDDILLTECLLPPLEEQKRIVSRLDEMKAKTSEMVAAYEAKLTAAKNLRQSILEAAFAGDL